MTGAGEGWELRGSLLYVLYLCNQRDMLMLFFSFSVSWGSEAGLGGEGDVREVQFGVWVLSKPYVLFSHLMGWRGQVGQILSFPPLSDSDMNIFWPRSADFIFLFSPMSHSSNFWGW